MKVFILILMLTNSIYAMSIMANSKDKEACDIKISCRSSYYVCIAAVAIAVSAGLIYLFLRV